MNTKMKRFRFLGGLVFVVAAFALGIAPTANAVTIIYQDDFSGTSATNLNGTAPDIRPGAETWSASTNWKTDGSITGAAGLSNAFLPFFPEAGRIYELSLTVDVTAGGNDWFALGFTELSATGSNFSQNSVRAAPWMLERAGNGNLGQQTQTFAGPNTGAGLGFPSTASPTDLKILLDTRSTLWTAEFYRDDVLLRALTYTTNPTINFVGFGKYNSAGGTVDNFSLVIIPEPSVALLCGFGTLALLGRRRR